MAEMDTTDQYDFLAGDGEMASLMRAYDWSSTPLGAPEHWPQSLKTVVRIMLTSRFAMWMAWGPGLTFFCNDAYRPTLGIKHPWALGKPANVVWAEIWDQVSSRIDLVLQTGTATWDEDLLLFLERSGFPEETYHTFSYSPVPGDDGQTCGMLCVVTEETERVIGERRLALLGELASGLTATNTEVELAIAFSGRIQSRPQDLPFALLYLFDPSREHAHLKGAAGIEFGSTGAPETFALDDPHGLWPAAGVLATGKLVKVEDLSSILPDPPKGPWSEPARQAVLVPIAQQAQEKPAGFVVAGLNPYRPFDATYLRFIELLVGQVAACLSNAHAYEDEKRRAEELAKLDQAKTTFFSNVSHELRTPLTLLLGPLEEAVSRADAEEAKNLAVAHKNSLRLLKLVNTLLDFSRIEAGRSNPRFEATDIGDFTKELVSNFESASDKAGINLVVDCRAVSSPVYVDCDMWEKIVLNLLSNALKNTFEGEISVSLFEETLEGKKMVTLKISDTGTGIPPEALSHIFERFYRVEGAAGRTHEGTGIGLSLVQELVQIHGGQVGVESKLGVGTTFSVSIPAGRSHLPEDLIRESETRLRPAALGSDLFVEEALGWLPSEIGPDKAGLERSSDAKDARPSILLADDNADMRRYIERLLLPRFRVETVGDGAAALEAARRERPDLIISDAMMPRLDGFGLLSGLREDPQLQEIPLLLLSARAGEEARVEGLDRGADDYLIKPFSARELIARAQSLLDLSAMRKRSKERLQRFAEALPLIAWECAADGSVAWVNPRFSEYTGIQITTPADREFQQFIQEDDRLVLGQAWRQASIDGKEFIAEVRLRRHDEALRWWLVRVAPDLDESGVIRRWYGSAMDIQDQKDLEHQLELRVESRTAELLEANREMEGFTYSVSHDLRTPLRSIVFNSGILMEELGPNLSDDHRDLLQRQIEAARRLAKLIDDLLKHSRITRQEMQIESVDLSRIAHTIFDQIPMPETVSFEISIEEGLVAQADPKLIEFIVSNLLENAVKFSPHGGRIEFGKTETEVGTTFFVSDQGVGFDEKYLNKIFEPFERLVAEREFPGTGIGLANVKRIVKRHQGSVWARSRPGIGSTFFFTLGGSES
jgi:PAS domain S-box-containing protein